MRRQLGCWAVLMLDIRLSWNFTIQVIAFARPNATMRPPARRVGSSHLTSWSLAMPLKNYSLLKGTIVDCQQAKANSPHYQIKVVDDTTVYRIAVNVKSDLNPPDLEF